MNTSRNDASQTDFKVRELENEEKNSDSSESNQLSDSVKIENLYDAESLYESLATSVSTFNHVHLPSFAKIFTFDYSKFYTLAQVTRVDLLENGWIVLYSQYLCCVFNMKTAKLIDIYNKKSFSLSRLDEIIYLPTNKVIIAVIDSPNYTPPYESYKEIKLYKVHSEDNIEEIILPKKIDWVKSVLAHSGETFITSLEHEGEGFIVVANDQGNILTIKRDASHNLTVRQNLIASSFEHGSTIRINKLIYITNATQENKKVKLVQHTIMNDSQVDYKYNQLQFVNDNLIAANCHKSGYLYNYDYCVRVWNIKNHQLVAQIPSPYRVNQLMALPNGWICILNNAQADNLQIWNLETGKTELSINVASPYNKKITISADCCLIIPQKEKVTFHDVALDPNRVKINIRPIPSTVFKFNLFYFHNLLKYHPKEVQLNDENLDKKGILVICRLMRYCTSIVDLDLSYNIFIIESLQAIFNLIEENQSINSLNLAGNNLQTSTFSYFLKELVKRNNKTLTSINMSNNKISCNKAELQELKQELCKLPSLKVIDISQNYLEEECDSLFEESKSEDNTSSYSFFRTTSKAVLSKIAPGVIINRENWLVCFCSHKDYEHAFLLLQGMKKNGQLFLKKFDITTASKLYGDAIVNYLTESISKYEKDKYYIYPFKISSIQGEILQRTIENEDKTKIEWTLYRTSTTRRVNCADWCIQHLANIDVHVESPIINTPRTIASQSRCAIS